MTAIWGKHVECMRRHKARPAMPLCHAITLQLFAHIAFMLLDHPLQTGHQMGDFEVFTHLQSEDFRAALLKTHQGLRALAQRLAWNGAIVHTSAPDAHVLLDDHHTLSKLCPLNGSLLPRGPTADHYNVIGFHRCLSPYSLGKLHNGLMLAQHSFDVIRIQVQLRPERIVAQVFEGAVWLHERISHTVGQTDDHRGFWMQG